MSVSLHIRRPHAVVRDPILQASQIIDNMLEGYAHCQMIFENRLPKDFVYLHVNDAFEKLTGLKNVVGKKASEAIPGLRESSPELFEIYGRVASTGRAERFDIYVDALNIWFSISVYSPQRGEFIAIFDNITARKAREREIERLTRLYAILSQINQCVLRVESRDELFREVCRITAEHSGFKLVWVGRHNRETHQVLPEACAGEGAAFLEGISVYADDRPEGRGGVGTAIREDKPCITDDYSSDPRAQPWRGSSAKYGFRAAAAFPIHFGSEVWGAFTVYAGETGIFRDKEIALLQDIAAAISHALDHLQQEEKRRQAEEALRESEHRLSLALAGSQTGAWERDVRTNDTIWSPEVYEMMGVEKTAQLYETLVKIMHPEDLPRYREATDRALADRSVWQLDFRIIRPDGEVRWVSAIGRATYREDGQPLRWYGTTRDITERKRAEAEREVTLQLLNLISAHDDLHELMREVTLLLRDSFGVQAVGIRLREGEDYPYFETRGFPAEFVRAESSLCERTPSGEIVSDPRGVPLLACMCGNVLSKRFDAGKPFFSARGSFWTNSTTELLAATTEADRMARTRNRCNSEGYESVALIAMRSGRAIHGLLQLNDARKGRFRPDTIALLERLADTLGAAVVQRQTQEALRRAMARAHAIMGGTIEAISTVVEVRDPYTAGHERRVAQLASAIAQALGWDADRVEGLRVTGYLHDIGKIAVPAEILSKPGTLSAMEMGIIRTHPQCGYDILNKIDFPWPVASVTLQHHERLDGSGYPNRLQGDQILSEARILAIADVVEAMSSHRPYRASLTIENALTEITQKPHLYDAAAAEACRRLIANGEFQFA